jgi:CheY-specific phosphatase CheX
MSNRYEENLYKVAEETFESLAFMFSMPADEAPAERPQETIAARVTFDGPFSGEVQLAIQSDLLPELTVNMLGLEEETPSPEQQQDALKEILNVICGNLLPAVAGTEAVFNIRAPQLLAKDLAFRCGPSQSLLGRITLPLDSGLAELALFAEQAACLG